MSKNNYINILLISWSWIIAWLLNYMYHPIMLKFLSLEQFWEFWTLVWMFNILSLFVWGFTYFLTKEISSNKDNYEKIKHIFLSSTKFFLLLGIIVYIIFLLFSPIIAWFIKVEIPLVILVWTVLLTSFTWASISAWLMWLKKFSFLWINSVIWPVLKLIVWVLLVYLWFWVYWALLWFIAAWILWFIISFFYLLNVLKNYKKIWNTKDLLKDFLSNKKEIINFFLVSLLYAFFMNIDVILIKNIFNSEIAWIYAWVSVLWKFLIYLLLSIETVYYWQIMEYKPHDVPKHLIKNPLVLIVITIFLAIVTNIFVWKFVLWTLKPELESYTKIYILNLCYYWFLVFISFFSKILVWWKKYFVNYYLIVLVLLLLILSYTVWKINIYNYIYSFIFVWFIWMIWTWIMFFKQLSNK